MTKQELLSKQFDSVYDKPSWFAVLSNSLSGLTPSQAAWKTDSITHSIWQIVYHLTFWNERCLRSFKGEKLEKLDITNDVTFESTEAEWNDTLDRVNRMMDGWRSALEGVDDAKLDSQAFVGQTDTWATVIGNINTHNAYHIGQIIVIRRLQGSWSPELGVQ